eukprot:1371185-Amorphochlora_amoeboformis.AAC.1
MLELVRLWRCDPDWLMTQSPVLGLRRYHSDCLGLTQQSGTQGCMFWQHLSLAFHAGDTLHLG